MDFGLRGASECRLDTLGSLLLRCEINAAHFTTDFPAAAGPGCAWRFGVQVSQFDHPGRISVVHSGTITARRADFLAGADRGDDLRMFCDSRAALDAIFAHAGCDPFF